MFSITAFLSYVFVSTFTPGPNNIMSMSFGSYFGYKKTFNFILGITAGFEVIMLVASYLNMFLLNFIPKIRVFMDILVFIYMIYLAIRILRSKPKTGEDGTDNFNNFFAGMTLQFINPKVLLFGITVTSSFVVPYYNSNTALILFSVILAFSGFLSNSCWALFGALFQKFLNKYRKPVNIFMAMLLVYCAVSIPELRSYFNGIHM
ncbi:LysE family transporter [Clostridium magnum]|uniref:Cysteine/O-acetylserine efflux protein n=1 Tax=Clostridium magnum DSM 2767 TaxID=1121326 RepID=A0A161YP92_9CLOT|nr:LysE family transporter [Clostridium magnum]KZL92592.1 cysteine/O-acetylserine efflux protein [Clostridium magnum DSM 2767]SHJ05943.1 Threonine/homoserine/homoserine lactone efflux protein [Clostridium magnum DSM 2767]